MCCAVCVVRGSAIATGLLLACVLRCSCIRVPTCRACVQGALGAVVARGEEDDEALVAALALSRQNYDEQPAVDVMLRFSMGLDAGVCVCLCLIVCVVVLSPRALVCV
jgi:hypothetical protein